MDHAENQPVDARGQHEPPRIQALDVHIKQITQRDDQPLHQTDERIESVAAPEGLCAAQISAVLHAHAQQHRSQKRADPLGQHGIKRGHGRAVFPHRIERLRLHGDGRGKMRSEHLGVLREHAREL